MSAPFSVRQDESQEIVLAIRRGKIDALVMAGPDGDEQVLTLQGTDHPYRVLIETINDGVATIDESGVILYSNTRFAAILRIPVQDFIGTPLQSHVDSSDQEALERLITEGLSNSSQGEITLHAAEGRPRLIRLALNPVKNSQPRTVSVVATELTELVEANEALRVNEESLRQLSARLLTLQDEERRHIARDLHDITGQKLAVQAMSLSQLQNRKSAVSEADTQRILTESVALNKQIGEEIRTLSYLLHPPLLDELGLSSAVQWYAEGFEQRTGIRVNVEIADFLRLPPDVEVTLFRIVQESLTNIHRYSGSAKAYVRMKQTSDSVELLIGDFGRGIHPDILNSRTGKIAPLGVGIQGMRQRMRQLGGKLEITSRPNKGTLVTATIPVSRLQETVPLKSESMSVFPPSEKSGEGPAQDRNFSRKQILIADGHELLRKGLRSMLEKETDWAICGEAVDGHDAVEKSTSLGPDLVILDSNLTGLSGIAAMREILRNRPETKFLVLSVQVSDKADRELQAAGAHKCLSKNSRGDDILKVVKDLFETGASSVSSGVGA